MSKYPEIDAVLAGESEGCIVHGDCLEVMEAMPDDSIPMIWTDPPYGHKNHDGDLNSQLNAHRGIEDKAIANDDAGSMRSVVDGMLLEAARILYPDCCCCCCCGGGGPKPTFAWIAERMDSKGMNFFHLVIWDKRNPGLGWRFRRQHEMVMVAHRTGGRLRWPNDSTAIPNIIDIYPPRNRLHPNEKPVELIQRFIDVASEPGDVILDTFFGSGSTGVAAKARGRRYIGIELDEEYCRISRARIRDTEKPLFV